ncbi:VOC family protein [uncultured Phenylobacterium sp.]|uniref:VOC family protein n=1 Tax=uncultured Phenylobacterium sp. TaxID=349273 RepID=UPI0025D98FC5|nr:VOC family protein [uncultured Phenylobacterium sp.]
MSETLETPTMPQIETKGGVVAYLAIDGALKAATFYETAFGTQTVFAHPADEQGRTMHVHLHINGSSVMLGDFYAEQGHPKETPAAFTMQLMVDDAQAWFDRAVAAGCEGTVPVQKMFWGDTWSQVRDPFGVIWAFNQPGA